MKVDQIQALLATLGGICDLNHNPDARDGLRKLSTLFEPYKNQDIKKVVKLIAQARTEAGLRK